MLVNLKIFQADGAVLWRRYPCFCSACLENQWQSCHHKDIVGNVRYLDVQISQLWNKYFIHNQALRHSSYFQDISFLRYHHSTKYQNNLRFYNVPTEYGKSHELKKTSQELRNCPSQCLSPEECLKISNGRSLSTGTHFCLQALAKFEKIQNHQKTKDFIRISLEF